MKGILENELFYCDHLGASEHDEKDILYFSVKNEDTGEGLVDYIKYYAFLEEAAGVMRTYLVRYRSTNELVGYFSLKAGLVSTNEVRTEEGILFDTVPGVELANFAVNNEFVKKYDAHGVGIVIFKDFVKPIIMESSKNIGIKIIYIFALPYDRLIKTYQHYGFARLSEKSEAELHQRLKPVYDQSCIFMFQTLRT